MEDKSKASGSGYPSSDSSFPPNNSPPPKQVGLTGHAEVSRTSSLDDEEDATSVLLRADADEGIAKPPADDPLIGTEIGGVRIVRMIAEGGMGRVYEGRQQRPMRAVAVKMIKRGIVSPKLLKRFDYEAQVLGRLRHPGIAQIYTVGTHDLGGQTVPFFVMEYIPNAKSLTEFAEERKLSTHERLELFAKVCEAVAHGHQKGVIHRDLKPGNVLVDSSGQPKVIDFGVARSADSDLGLTTMQTDVGVLIGTLQYMSPEQFDADPNDLDVRLDVYALGVILYQLLTGKPPYHVKQQAFYEIARIVREEEPTPISSLNKTLRRDVAIIAAKCLQKDRTRRYSNATELGGDVRRYLAGEQIVAAPPTLWDALIRLARRHKAAAVAVTAIALSLVATGVGITAFAMRAELARDEAELARDEAELAREEAELAREEESVQRNRAEEQRTIALEQKAAAESATRQANRQLYVSTLYKLGSALESPSQRRLAKNTWTEAMQVYRALYGDDAKEPVELTVLGNMIDTSLAYLQGHTNCVTAVAFSPDATHLATASWDNTARIWDTATGEALAVLEGHEDALISVVFSADGTRLATASWDNTARIWDAATGKLQNVLTGHTDSLKSVVFSPDGTRLATASGDNTARIWDAITGELMTVLEGHGAAVLSTVFSPDGAQLATASSDDTARIWNAETGDVLAVLKGHESLVASIAFSPDGTRLATASGDNTARIWEANTGRVLAVLEGHEFTVNSIVFSPDGAQLATASSDNTARIWNVSTGETVAVLEGHENLLNSVVFNTEGTQLATSSNDNTARVWDASTGEPLAVLNGHDNYVNFVVFSGDGSRLATASYDFTARIWDASTNAALAVLDGHGSTVNSITFSHDGRRLATASRDKTARLWDAETGEALAVLEGHQNLVNSAVFSPDGTRLATASWDNTARVWDTATGEALAVLEGHQHLVNSVAFSPDGRRLATASSDNTARIWNTETGEALALFQGHERYLSSAVFSPDGARLATASWDHTARIWNAETGDVLAVLKGHENLVASVIFSPDGSRIATASWDNTARIWDAETGDALAVLEGHENYVNNAVFSPDGTRLATASYDNTARVWDAFTGETIAAAEGHELTVQSIVFSPDGTRLATSSWDNTARVWDAETGEALAVLGGHTNLVNSVAFNPAGTRLATASYDHTARIWGFSNREIARNRLVATSARRQLEPLVDGWLARDPATPKADLVAAKAMLSDSDWQQAANLLLLQLRGTSGSGSGSLPTLMIGSKAPTLNVAHWVQTDNIGANELAAITETFTPDEVYVVACWATWSPPCRTTVPHLAVIQDRFRDDGVKVIGVSNEELETVEAMLDIEAEPGRTFREIAAAYLIAADPDRSVWRDYLEASGREGIPIAFIVGKTGEIEWIGHPLELEEPLAAIVAGTFDRQSAANAIAVKELARERYSQAIAMAREGQPADAVERLNSWLKDTNDPEAIAAFRRLRNRFAIQAGGTLAQQVFNGAVSEAHESSTALNELAWVVEQQAAAGQEVSADLLQAAVAAARRAVELEPARGEVLDTLAHLLVREGNVNEAVDVQRKAVAATNHDDREPLQTYLTDLETIQRIRMGDLHLIDAKRAAEHVGQWCVVNVPAVSGQWEDTDGPCVLTSFEEAAVRVVISVRGLRNLEAADVFDPALAYRGRTVEVAGLLTLSESGPQIEVVVPEQIRLTEIATESETPVADPSVPAAATVTVGPSPLDGVWRMVLPEGQADMKIVVDGHFVRYVREERKITRSVTGRCSLEGDRYTEEIAARDVDGAAWTMAVTRDFRARLVGNQWFQENALRPADGETAVREVWERVDP